MTHCPNCMASLRRLATAASPCSLGGADSTLGAVHKIAFELGPLTITWYGIFVASGFLFGLWNASRRALRENIDPEAIFDCGTWLLIGAIAGARALYVVSYWPDIVNAARDYGHSPVGGNFHGATWRAGLLRGTDRGLGGLRGVRVAKEVCRSGNWRTSWRRAWRWVRFLAGGVA